jgi:hypothetical protein
MTERMIAPGSPAARAAFTAVLLAVGIVAGGCDRSPLGSADIDPQALESLGGPTAAGRSVAFDLIAVATQLQAEDGTVLDISLPTLAELFDGAISADAETRGPGSALALESAHTALLDSAWSEIANGNGAAGDRILEEARSYQASAAARFLGRPTSVAYVFLIGRTLQRVNERLLVLHRRGEDVRRLRRMASSARELEADAREALGRGESGDALDIGAHAADLVNNLIREIRTR